MTKYKKKYVLAVGYAFYLKQSRAFQILDDNGNDQEMYNEEWMLRGDCTKEPQYRLILERVK